MDLKESLRDIAELLLLIHEKYFGDAKDEISLFYNQVGLLQALKVLGNSVTIIDTEMCRRDLCTMIMEYEQFYKWLRNISCTLFSGVARVHGSSAAFQKLLTDRIIPLASAGFPETVEYIEELWLPSTVFDIFEAYYDMFKLLFMVTGEIVSVRLSSVMDV